MRVLITGICGFVGAAIARYFRDGWPQIEVIGIDNFCRPGSERNRPLLRQVGVQVRIGDIRRREDLEDLPQSDWIIDAAAQPSVGAGADGKMSSGQVVAHNLEGTLNVLELCRRWRCGLVLLSTSRLYSIETLRSLPLRVEDDAFVLQADQPLPAGCSGEGISEDFSTRAPVSLYGATKLASEVMAAEYAITFGFPLRINRCGVIAGPGQFGTAEQGIFSYWIRAYATRRPMRYIGFDGTGHQVRDALHPLDLAELVRRQIDQAPAGAETYTVGGGRANAMSLAQLSRWCAARFGNHTIERDLAQRQFDVPWVIMDARRAAERFGWRPQRSIDAILEEIAAHHEAHPSWLETSEAI
jgi:CDP-paratose 2-epimerase